MNRVADNKVICESDPTTNTSVYIGGLFYLERANDKLKWRDDDGRKILTLKEVAEQLNARLITVFVESSFEGVIYQFGNYGDSWWQIGETCGYA